MLGNSVDGGYRASDNQGVQQVLKRFFSPESQCDREKDYGK